MSSNKQNKDLLMYLEYLKLLCGEKNQLNNNYNYNIEKHMNNLNIIDPKVFNILDMNDKPIHYQSWFSSNKKLNMSPSHNGVFLNIPLLLKQQKYQWFLNMDIEQVKMSNTIIGQYLRHYEN